MSNDVIVSIEPHQNAECPSEDGDGMWMLHPFDRNHHNHKDPSEFGFYKDSKTGDINTDNEEFAKKLEVGLAFVVSYFEHSNCAIWHHRSEIPFGTEGDYRWDGTDLAGVLIWPHDEGDMGAKTFEDRKSDAREFLKTYSAWCRGEVYGYSVREVSVCGECGTEKDGEILDSCWGFYADHGMEDMLGEIRTVTTGKKVIRIEGEAKGDIEIEQVQGPNILEEA